MSFAFIQDVPANEEIHAQIRERLGDTPPSGLVAHIAFKREGGLRYVDVWESEEAWQTFHDQTLQPTVDSVLAGFGIVPDESMVSFERIDVVDAWVQEPAAAAVG